MNLCEVWIKIMPSKLNLIYAYITAKKRLIMTIEEKIEALFELTIHNIGNEYKRIDVGVVSQELGVLIHGLTNIDVTGFAALADL